MLFSLQCCEDKSITLPFILSLRCLASMHSLRFKSGYTANTWNICSHVTDIISGAHAQPHSRIYSQGSQPTICFHESRPYSCSYTFSLTATVCFFLKVSSKERCGGVFFSPSRPTVQTTNWHPVSYQVFMLKPGMSLRSTYLAQFLLLLHRKALTLLKYIEDET